jgi:hypothetical protein
MRVVKFFLASLGVALLIFAALPTSHGDRTPLYYTTMKADLRNMVTAQELFFADSARYARSREELSASRYQASTGDSVWIVQAGDSAFSAVAQHERLASNIRCEISISIENTATQDLGVEPICHPEYKRKWWVRRGF